MWNSAEHDMRGRDASMHGGAGLMDTGHQGLAEGHWQAGQRDQTGGEHHFQLQLILLCVTRFFIERWISERWEERKEATKRLASGDVRLQSIGAQANCSSSGQALFREDAEVIQNVFSATFALFAGKKLKRTQNEDSLCHTSVSFLGSGEFRKKLSDSVQVPHWGVAL